MQRSRAAPSYPPDRNRETRRPKEANPRSTPGSHLCVPSQLEAAWLALDDAARWYLDAFLDGRGAIDDPRLSRSFECSLHADALPYDAGRRGFAAHLSLLARAFPSRSRTLLELERAPGALHARIELVGTHEQVLFDLLQPTGRLVRLEVTHTIRWGDQGVAADTIALDPGMFLRQLMRGSSPHTDEPDGK